MINTWQSLHLGKPETGTYHKFTGSKKCPKIDHISISEYAHVLDSKIDNNEINGRCPSDHFPEIATIRFQMDQPVSFNW